MPQRQNIIAFDSTEVQGEGSWIKVRMITHGQRKEYLRNYGDIIGKASIDVPLERRIEFQEHNDALLVRVVVDWNWVDEDGNPLPLPKDDLSVVDSMTEAENTFISRAMQGEGERKK